MLAAAVAGAAIRRGDFVHADEVPVRTYDVRSIIWHGVIPSNPTVP